MKPKRLFVGLTILIIVFAHGCEKKAIISDEMVGTWNTTDSKYKETSFELTPDKIIFRTLGGEVNANTIKKIKTKKAPDTEEILFTLTYVNIEGQESVFSFFFGQKNGGIIRFQNQPEIIWTKERD
ncbi:MAG: hypothetical protein PVF66_04955 [Candidatus Aminicenantes bacterium]|jgi:hypothetical protein